MRDSHYRITLDITETQSQVSLPVKKGDTSRKIYISLVEGSQPYEIDGSRCLAVLSGKKADGTEIEHSCIIEGNTIRYDFTEQTATALGLMDCEITLYDIETGVIASPHFNIIVDNRVIENPAISESERKLFDDLVTAVGDFNKVWNTDIADPKVWELDSGIYRVSGNIYISETGQKFGPFDKTILVITKYRTNFTGFVLFFPYNTPTERWAAAGKTDGTTYTWHYSETTNNKVGTVDEKSTTTQYPSAKAVYNLVLNESSKFQTAEDERQAAEDDRQAMWNNCVENTKVWELNPGCYYASGIVAIDPEAMFYVHDKTLLYVSKDAEDETKKRFVLFLAYAQDIPYEIITGTTDGTISEWYGIETVKNRVNEINEKSSHEQYPSAKAVYELFSDFDKNSLEYKELVADDFQNGSLISGSDIAYAIVLKKLIPVSSGDLIKVAPGNGYKVWYKLVNSEDLSVALNIYNGGNTAEEREYTATQDGWLVVQVSRVNGTKITPDDYCCDISITNRKDDMEILTEVDIEAEHSNNQVYGAAAMDEALLEIGEILGEKKSSSEDSVDALFSKHTPFTHIVDNCQDITKWTVTNTSSELAQVDATNCILGTQSLRSNNSMRSTANSYDLTNNYLVLKLRINIIGKGSRLLLNICNKNTPSIRATYELGRGTSWTTPEGWQEIIISSDNYSSITGDVDFSNVDDIHLYTSVLAGTDTAKVDWNLQYLGTRPKATNKGIVTFTFDDGWDTQYTGVKLLAEKGITSTIFCIKEAVESGNYLTLEALKKLVNYYGTDIEVHGDPSYDQWDEEELKKHWSESQQFLKENGLGEGKHMAYPNGMFPENVVELAKDYFDSCRTIIPFVPIETLPVADRYRIRAVSGVGEANVKAKTVKQYIDRVAKDGGWLILVLHKIGDNANDSMYCSENDLAAIADYAIDSGVDIMNYAEVMERCYAGLSPRKDIVNETTVATPKNKVFERIATVTVSPDESGNLPGQIIFNEDENGNAFELTDVYCDMSIGFTDGSNGKLTVKFGKDYILGNLGAGITNTLRKWWFRYDSYGEGLGGLCIAPNTSIGSGNNYPNNNVYGLFGQPVPVGKTLNISDLTFSVSSGTTKTFIEGTTITIWGVRK